MSYERIPTTPDPKEIPSQPIAEAVTKLRELDADRDRTIRERGDLTEALSTAEQHATDQLADSIRTGKAAPANKEPARIRDDIDTHERRLAALEVAITRQIADVQTAVLEHREAAMRAFDPALGAAAREYETAIERMAAARSAFMTIKARRSWLEHYERQPAFKGGPTGGYVKLTSASGDPFSFEVVLAALKADADQTPARKPEVRPLLRLDTAQSA